VTPIEDTVRTQTRANDQYAGYGKQFDEAMAYARKLAAQQNAAAKGAD
jgi:hypothetical protein